MRRCIGLDVHREFAQVAIWEDGLIWQAGRIQTTPEALRDFADSLCATDEVALEATGNTHAIARLLERHVGRVVVSNPQKTRAIAEAKVKTDKVDAAVLAGLLAADYLPSVWLPDDQTHALRRQVTRRAHIVRQRTRLKNQVQSILHRNLIGRCPAADLFGTKGRAWLADQDLPHDEHQAVGALLRQLDFHGQELRIVDAELGRVGLERAEVRRLMTIPGVDATVALAIVAAVGDFGRFSSPQRLVSYLGLNPRGAPVRRPARPTRPDHQARPGARPRHAGGGRLGGGQDPRAAACLLRACPRPTRHAGRRGGHRPQARHAVLAPGRWRPGLRLRAALTHRQEAPGAGAARRHATPAGSEGHRGRLFPQGGPPARAGAHRAGRSRLPPARRRLATQAASDQAPMTS
jgi:transposase